MAAQAALIASRVLCASCSTSVLLDLDARRLEHGVVLRVPVQVAEHTHGNGQRTDDKSTHDGLLRPFGASTLKIPVWLRRDVRVTHARACFFHCARLATCPPRRHPLNTAGCLYRGWQCCGFHHRTCVCCRSSASASA